MKRKVAFLLAALLFAAPANAAVIDTVTVDNETTVMRVTGEAPGGLPYADVNVLIYKEGADLSGLGDFSEATMQESIVSFEQLTADEQGMYTAYFDMAAQKADDLVIRVRTEGMDAYEERPYYFATYQDKLDAIAAMKACKTAGELAAFLDLDNEKSMTVRTLEITDPQVFAVQANGLSEVLFAMLEKTPPETPDATVAMISLAANIQTLYESKVENILDYAKLFAFPKAFVDTYTSKVTAENRAAFGVLFVEKRLNSAEEVCQYFCDNVILSVVNNVTNPAYIGDILETHGEYINSRVSAGLQLSRYKSISDKSKVWLPVSGGSYPTLESFVTKCNAAIALAGEIGGSGTGSSGTSRPTGGGGGTGGGNGFRGNAAFTASPDMTAPPVEPEKIPGNLSAFSDLEGYDWAKESIEALAAQSIVGGDGSGQFMPGQSVLREELVKMLSLALDLNLAADDPELSDVEANQWYYKYIAAAKAAGIVNGNGDGTFGIGNAVTRQDVCVMLYRAISAKQTLPNGGEVFDDDAAISAYAKDAVYALRNAGMISGMGDNLFAPSEPCTRAQAAKMMHRMITILEQEGRQ